MPAKFPYITNPNMRATPKQREVLFESFKRLKEKWLVDEDLMNLIVSLNKKETWDLTQQVWDLGVKIQKLRAKYGK